jgi:hypothetical protein
MPSSRTPKPRSQSLKDSGPVEPSAKIPAPRKRYIGRITVNPGKVIEISEKSEAPSPEVDRPEIDAIAATLGLYQRAAKTLLSEKYRELAEVAPAKMRAPCDCWVIVGDDGIIVRWDKHEGEEAPRVRVGWPQEGATSVEALAPGLSERYVYCITDMASFELPPDGLKIGLGVLDAVTGEFKVVSELGVAFLVNWAEIQKHLPLTGNRPVPLVAVGNEVDIQLEGEEFNASAELKPGTGREFLVASRHRLAVGWEAIEIYAPFESAMWRPELASDWAEFDLLAASARHNLRQKQLDAIDPRAATRRQYGERLKEFRSLLDGPEADLQAFLEDNPELLSPTHLRMWKKVPLGRRFTDFVFKEPNEYVLVELEAPSRPLFRKDGQQSEELTHAIKQVNDWLRYIEDNPDTVRRELGLEGISTHPECLIVIGRSASLNEQDQRQLVTMQGTMPKFRILTYDDAVVAATQSITNLLGSIPQTEGAVEIYYKWGRPVGSH